MKIARVTGTVTATAKDEKLGGVPLVIVDVEDGAGNVLEKSMVAANVGAAGTGDTVLVTTGSAARLPTAIAGMAIDASVIAIVDHLELSN